MVDHDEEAAAVSRFGWFSAGALAVLIPIGVFLLAGSLLRSTELDESTPPVIIEAR